MTGRGRKPDTQVTHLGRDARRFEGAVNPPAYRVSTVLTESLDDYEDPRRRYRRDVMTYGRYGTPTSRALEDAIAELDGGHGTVAVSSGLGAIAKTLLGLLQAGDHLLMVDTVYLPSRRFCDRHLARMGIETTYYDPMIGARIADLIRPNTRVVFLESPGSSTFEVQDVPAIAAAAREAGAVTVIDNTWATPLYFRPIEHGVDVAIQSATKYIGGHADLMMGLITAVEVLEPQVRRAVYELGDVVGSEEVYLALRGLRTLSVRLARHQETGLRLARWLQERPEVERVLHPALPGHPGHELWRRDFDGATGLFGVVLAEPYPREAVKAMIEGMELFGIGSSWGGYESLMIATYPEALRTATRWQAPDPALRIHAGLEDPEDLIADLETGFERLHRAAGD